MFLVAGYELSHGKGWYKVDKFMCRIVAYEICFLYAKLIFDIKTLIIDSGRQHLVRAEIDCRSSVRCIRRIQRRIARANCSSSGCFRTS